MKVVILLSFFLYSSCSTGVKIDSRYCKSLGSWSTHRLDQNNSNSYTHRYFSFGMREISLKDIFENERVNCTDLSEISVRIERTFLDSALSILPGFSSQTITVLYK